MEKKVFTIAEIAEILSISKSYAYQLVNEDVIPNLKLGRRRVVPIEKFNKWLNQSETE
jgi:excisionase family DNA binding protein